MIVHVWNVTFYRWYFLKYGTLRLKHKVVTHASYKNVTYKLHNGVIHKII